MSWQANRKENIKRALKERSLVLECPTTRLSSCGCCYLGDQEVEALCAFYPKFHASLILSSATGAEQNSLQEKIVGTALGTVPECLCPRLLQVGTQGH